MLINSYDFFTDTDIQNAMHFVVELNNYSYVSNAVLTIEQVQQNFFNIVNNLYKLQQYLGVNEKWSLLYPPQQNKLDIMSVQNIKHDIRKILIKSFRHKTCKNIIFEYHRVRPFTGIIEDTYKFLINTLLYNIDCGIDQKAILSLYLAHAAFYNHTRAINILLAEYTVSPILTWPDLYEKYAYAELTIMPILLTANTTVFNDHLKFFDVSREEQQYNFILMLRHINFSQNNISLLQIQQIFKCALDNNFFYAINFLLEQVEICSRIEFSQENVRLLEENAKMKEQIYLLERQINKLQIDLQHRQQQNEVLLSKQEVLLNKFYYKRCYNCLILPTPPESPANLPDRLSTYLKLQFASPN